MNETRSIFYKENCAANRFCVITHKGKARHRSASHLRDTKKNIITKIAKYWIIEILYFMKKIGCRIDYLLSPYSCPEENGA